MPKKSKDNSAKDTPIYCLDAFSKKADDTSFYIENFKDHLQHHDFVSKPHKHDFYLILYITSGGGTHTIDFHTYPIAANSFFVMTPGQVHSWKLENDTDGYIIFFRRDFYQLQLSENSLIEFPFFHSLNANPLIKSKRDKTIDIVLEEMNAEFKNKERTDLRILRTYLDVLLLKLARSYRSENDVSLNSTIFKLRKLEQLIDKNFLKLKQPSDYADLMNLSPSYLNTICKQNLDKTLSDLIQERILLEAKRLFAYTDQTTNQVASRLNFSDTSYFIRFFKKHTGLTSDQFKESINRPV
jgi:AraC-like DNA-binding protein